MKNNYLKISITLIVMLFVNSMSYAQDVHFTFANAQNTNDGVDDFYEVDVMIQTINSTGSFKLGSGQLYFNYSTAAFGSSLFSSGGFEVTQLNADGYIAGQFVDVAAADIYGVFTLADNTPSALSWSFSQVFSASTFAADNVTDTPTKLCHLKLKYADVLEEPMLTYEDAALFTDQFDTACGPAGGAFTAADCGTDPGTLLVNDTFDSAGAVLSIDSLELSAFDISVYPNPVAYILNIKSSTPLNSIEIYDLNGRLVMRQEYTSTINVKRLVKGAYFLKLVSENGIVTKKIIKK